MICKCSNLIGHSGVSILHRKLLSPVESTVIHVSILHRKLLSPVESTVECLSFIESSYLLWYPITITTGITIHIIEGTGGDRGSVAC